MNEKIIDDVLTAFLLNNGVETFINELICKLEKNKYINLKKIKNKPKFYRKIIDVLEKIGIVSKHSNNVLKVINRNALERLYKNIENQKDILSGDMVYQSLQSIMYDVGREIAKKEGCTTVEAITSILIAYYIENYGEDEYIKKIIKNIRLIDEICSISSC